MGVWPNSGRFPPFLRRNRIDLERKLRGRGAGWALGRVAAVSELFPGAGGRVNHAAPGQEELRAGTGVVRNVLRGERALTAAKVPLSV